MVCLTIEKKRRYVEIAWRVKAVLADMIDFASVATVWNGSESPTYATQINIHHVCIFERRSCWLNAQF